MPSTADLGSGHGDSWRSKTFGPGAKHLDSNVRKRHDSAGPAAAPDQLRGSGPGATAVIPPPAPAAASAEELHPSWAAKARSKALLAVKPQGTKVVFSEDGDIMPSLLEAAAPSALALGGVAKPARSGRPDRSGVPGRGSGTMSNGAAPGSRLNVRPQKPMKSGQATCGRGNPSWEAKAALRKKMEHIPSPQGTKVAFEDSGLKGAWHLQVVLWFLLETSWREEGSGALLKV